MICSAIIVVGFDCLMETIKVTIKVSFSIPLNSGMLLSKWACYMERIDES